MGICWYQSLHWALHWRMAQTTIHNYLLVKGGADKADQKRKSFYAYFHFLSSFLWKALLCLAQQQKHYSSRLWLRDNRDTVNVMECRPAALDQQIDAVVLMNARVHPPRLVEAWQLYWYIKHMATWKASISQLLSSLFPPLVLGHWSELIWSASLKYRQLGHSKCKLFKKAFQSS